MIVKTVKFPLYVRTHGIEGFEHLLKLMNVSEAERYGLKKTRESHQSDSFLMFITKTQKKYWFYVKEEKYKKAHERLVDLKTEHENLIIFK